MTLWSCSRYVEGVFNVVLCAGKKIMNVRYILQNIFKKNLTPPLTPLRGGVNIFNATLTRFFATWHEKCDFSHFFSNSSMKKWVTFRKKYYDLYSCGNLTCVVLCNRMRNEKDDKKLLFHLYNTGRNIFWYFHVPLRKRWKKWFPSFKKDVYTLVIIIFEIYFNLVVKDFPGRWRAKCTKLSRCCFWQCSCKPKFTIFSRKFCPRNKLFWNSFPQRYLW